MESGTTLLVAIEIQNIMFGEVAARRSFIGGGSMNTFQADAAAKFNGWNYFIGHILKFKTFCFATRTGLV